MKFTYKYITQSDANSTFWGEITNDLNALSVLESASVKIAASDDHDSDSRATIVYCDTAAPGVGSLSNIWSYHEYETGNDYEDMIQELVNELNGVTNNLNLSDTQKYFSRIVFTNADDDDSRLTLFWLGLNDD